MILHPQLAKDCFVLGRFELSVLLMMNDNQYPWFILVPQRENISEIHHMTEADQQLLLQESSRLSIALEQAFDADKINVAALGNVVPQLHVHHIARFKHDATWPKPVWGARPAQAYTHEEKHTVIQHILSYLPNLQTVNV